jgi:uncharacterized protein YutE (UPF0331/DUF86 family)
VTDPALVAKKLALIETYVRELRTLGRPDALRRDIREERFILHTLQLAAQATLDIASHVVSDERLGEPETYREIFELLARHGWLEPALAAKLEDLAGFRNVVVHGYADVDLNVVEDVVRNHLDDLLSFVRTIRARVP